MSETGDTEDQHAPHAGLLLAEAEDFAEADLIGPLSEISQTGDLAIERALSQAAKEAEIKGDKNGQRAYQLLSYLCTFHLRVEDPANVWGARWVGPDGRSYMASDFRGEQTHILASIIDRISHPFLKARVADVAWYNDRTQSKAAEAAVASYCEIIEKRLTGELTSQFEELNDSILDLTDYLQRAFQIISFTRKRGDVPVVFQSVLEALYQRALATAQYVAFQRIARLGVESGIKQWDRVASDAETMATAPHGGDYALARQGVWNLAVEGYAKQGNKDAKRRCQERSVDETLRMREAVQSPMAQAYWTRKAIGELRAAGGFKQRVTALLSELYELEEASLDDLVEFNIPIDVKEERQGTIELYGRLTLPEVLLQFAVAAQSPKVSELRQSVNELSESSPLSSIMGISHTDNRGKIVAETPSVHSREDDQDDWFRGHVLQLLDIRRHQIVGSLLEPARYTVMQRFPLEERHFATITSMSPFIPPGHEYLFALGFARFWQGDYASAVHILLPQLENSLRHVLLNHRWDTSKLKPDLLQEDRSLSGLLESVRPQLTTILGEDLVFEIDMLFHYKAGPALRHELAHGKMAAGDCYSATAVYACWLIYQLTCLPLIRHWKDIVAPAIEQSAL